MILTSLLNLLWSILSWNFFMTNVYELVQARAWFWYILELFMEFCIFIISFSNQNHICFCSFFFFSFFFWAEKRHAEAGRIREKYPEKISVRFMTFLVGYSVFNLDFLDVCVLNLGLVDLNCVIFWYIWLYAWVFMWMCAMSNGIFLNKTNNFTIAISRLCLLILIPYLFLAYSIYEHY